METPTGNPGSVQAVAEAASRAVTPDERTAAILAKHQRREKLTPSEGGILGQFKKKLKGALGGAPAPVAPSVSPVASPAVVPVQASAGSLPVVPPSPDLVRGTVKSVLDSCNEIGKRAIVRAAQAARANPETLDAFRGKMVFGENRSTLIVNTAPDAFRAMGIGDGEAFALSIFWGNIGLGALDFWQAIDELKALTERNEAANKKRDAANAQAVTQPGTPTPGPSPSDEKPRRYPVTANVDLSSPAK